MKYTKNLHNKLLLAGFEFQYEHEEIKEEYLNYSVYKKGVLEVTVCDSHKVVDIHLDADEKELSHLSYEQFMKLDKIINQEK
jgi:hypothetical protein